MYQKGFSLLEVLLIIALVGVLLGAGIPVLYSYFSGNNLDSASSRVTQSLYQAKTFAEAGVDDSEWGVYIQNGLVTIFQGNDYAGRDAGYDQDIELAEEIAVSGIDEIYFSVFSGSPSATGDIVLSIVGERTATISINSLGIIQ